MATAQPSTEPAASESAACAQRRKQKRKKLFHDADDFFIPVSAEIFNDFETGRMTLAMWGTYSVLLRQVDFETGIWRGTSYKISFAWGDRLQVRTVQRAMKRLAENGYIKIFHRKNGEPGSYHVLIHHYRIRFGPLAGHFLDAAASMNADDPVYKPGYNLEEEEDRDTTASRPRHDRVTTPSVQTSLPYSSRRTHKREIDTALRAAVSAFQAFQREMDDKTAFKLVLWVLYRAASVEAGAKIPKTVDYYLKAKNNLIDEPGWETKIDDAAVRGFNSHASHLLEEKSPALLAWLQDKADEFPGMMDDEEEITVFN